MPLNEYYARIEETKQIYLLHWHLYYGGGVLFIILIETKSPNSNDTYTKETIEYCQTVERQYYQQSCNQIKFL